MADIKCKLVKHITSPDAYGIVTLPQVPKENAVLKVHNGTGLTYYRVQAIAYETINESTTMQAGRRDPKLNPGYLVVVTETSERDLDYPTS